MPPSNVIVDRRLLQALTQSVHSFFTRAEPLEWSEEHSALVEYGIGRFVDQHNKVKIEEPLVLVAVTRFFQTIANTPLQDVRMHLQLNQGQAFEEIVLLTMTKMFETPIKLSDIVEFHGVKPPWADDLARIVCPNSPDLSPYSIDKFSDPDSILPWGAKDPVAVTRWLKDGQAGWCIPGNMMGPDLMACLLINGKRVLMVIQIKCRTTGNKDKTMTADVTTDAIKSLIPSDFFKSLVRYRLISSYIFVDFHCL